MHKNSSVFPLILLAAASASLCSAQVSQVKRPMTFEDTMKMKRLGETTVSPDGRWLAYSVTTVDLGKNSKKMELFLKKVEGGEPQHLAVTGPGDSGVQFSPDGKQILFLSSRDGGQQIWLADFDSATSAVLNPRKLTSIATEADNARWSPDGRSIVFTSAVYPDCPAITVGNAEAGDKCNADRDAGEAASKVKAQIFIHLLYRHWDHFTGPKRSHLFLIGTDGRGLRDLTPNDPHDVPPFSMGGDGGFSISPDAKELAFTENLDEEPAISTNADIFTLDLTDTAAKPVRVSTSSGGDFSPQYSPDGNWLAWRSQERAGYESDKFRLMLYDRATKTAKDLLPRLDRWVDEFTWAKDSRMIYFVAGDEGEAPIYSIGVGGGDLLSYKKMGGEWSDLHTLPNPDTKHEVIVGSLMTVDRPAEIVAADLDKAAEANKVKYEPRYLTSLNYAVFEELDTAKLESFWFSAADHTKVQGFLIQPPGFNAAKKYPVKFLIHGGPQGAWGDSWSYRWNAELLAANGYVVVMINPRGSTGYGQAFVDGVNGDWGGKPFTDLMEGLDYAEQHYPFIDKSRECALGASYGGFMANWILGHTDRFKCIVSHDGMFNPESAYGSTEEMWFNEWEFKGKPWDYYGKPDEENPFRKWSPAMSAKNFKTPTLVIHSQNDYRLDVSEGYQLFGTLQRLKVPSEMLYFPDESHWVLKPQNSELWYKTVNAWVDRWTKQQ